NCILLLYVVLFFFSSRRRHTRCYRDWSSDVCSSDLAGETADFMIVDNHPYQVVIVPLLAPVPIAWIGMGFQIDGALAQELAKTTSAQVSFVRAQDDRRWAGIASTLSPAAQQSLLDTLSRDAAGGRPRVAFELSDSDFETLVVPLPSSIGAGIHVALQRS